MADKILDAKGLKCPMPIAKISSELNRLDAGQTLEVYSDDAAFAADVKAFCRVTGNVLDSLNEDNGITAAIIKKAKKDN